MDKIDHVKEWNDLSFDEKISYGRKILIDLEDGSALYSEEAKIDYATFEREELGLGKILGQGSFCDVSEILAMRLLGQDTDADEKKDEGVKTEEEAQQSDDIEVVDIDGTTRNMSSEKFSLLFSQTTYRYDDSDSDDESGDKNENTYTRDFMAENCIRADDARYAIKRMRKFNIPEDTLAKGIIDLANEAKILQHVFHSNIIKMRGMASCDHFSSDFFIVLDRLYDTLEERIIQMRDDYKGASGRCMGFGSDTVRLNSLWADRLVIAYDLSSALKFLHQKNIIYRDLKPENIGFDIRGDCKLFDFGLARELRPNLKTTDGLYTLTGLTGSKRYMAPEVVLCKPYNLGADVFSFSVLIWEIMALKTPFLGYSVLEHKQRIVERGERPQLKRSWPKYLKSLLKSSWDDNIGSRYDMPRISGILRSEIGLLSNREDISNRTRHMMNRSRRSRRGRDMDTSTASGR